MSELEAQSPPPKVISLERTLCILDGAVQSRADEERLYYPRILLTATHLCTCRGSQARDSLCVHLKALLEQVDAAELRQFILDAQTIPAP